MNNPIVIAGGGLAGAASAALLARAGRQVTVFERATGPVHKICGEFLSTEAQVYLTDLGIDVSKLGGAVISKLRLTKGMRSAETPLPFRGVGLSRMRLDEAVLRYAEQCGAVICRGRTITNVETQNGIRLTFSNAETITAETLFLATGKHDLRGTRRNVPPPADLVGFKMYFALNRVARAELAGRIDLILFRGGYAGLQMIEDNKANLCLLVDRTRLRIAGGKWAALLDELRGETPVLARVLDGAQPLMTQPLTIYRVPYGFIHRSVASDRTNLYRLGDQIGVIPSFTGDGMGIALHSAAVATSMFLRGADAASYHRRLAKDIAGQISRAQLFYRLANAVVLSGMFLSLVGAFPGSLKRAASLTRVPINARLTEAQVREPLPQAS